MTWNLKVQLFSYKSSYPNTWTTSTCKPIYLNLVNEDPNGAHACGSPTQEAIGEGFTPIGSTPFSASLWGIHILTSKVSQGCLTSKTIWFFTKILKKILLCRGYFDMMWHLVSSLAFEKTLVLRVKLSYKIQTGRWDKRGFCEGDNT